MRRCNALCLVVLVGGLLGCQKAQLEPDANQTKPHAKQKVYSSSMNFQLDINVADLPGIITSALDQLGVTIEETNEQTGRYEYIGKSLSEASVNVKAYALVVGKSVLAIEVRGPRGSLRGTCKRN